MNSVKICVICGETGSLLFRFNYSHPGLLGASAGFKIIS